MDASISYNELCDEVHEMCNLQQEQPITLKWIDDEGTVLRLKVYSALVQRRGVKGLVSSSFMLWSSFCS